MSDAPREEEIYQALAPGGSYKSGLVNPVAAQQETTVSVPIRFKGAMGGQAVGNDEYPDHEPRASVPYKHYKDLEDIDPKLHEAVTHVADEIHIPRTDLASLVYANSNYNPSARNGMRTGYMGLTPDDARQLDPEGHLDINDPIDNLFMGAMKYKRISNRFGMGTPNAFAAYHGGGDRIHSLLDQDPDEHRRMAPDGTFEFLNKILGRGEGSGSSASPAEDPGGGGDTPEVPGAMLRGPQSFPDSWAPMSRARNMEPDREAALMRSQGPVAPPPNDTGMAARSAPPAGPSSSYGGDDAGWQRPAPPRPPPATNVPAATAGIERAIGAQRGQPPVPPPPSGERMIPGAVNPNQVDIQRALTDPAYREQIMPTTSGPGAPYAPPPTRLPAEQQPGQVFDVSGARAAVAAGSQAIQGSPEEEAVARGVSVEQVTRERAARVPAQPPPRDLEGQRAQAYAGPMPPPYGSGPSVAPEGGENQLPGPALTGAYGPLAPPPPAPQPPPPAVPDTYGGYGVGGALRQTPPTVPGEASALPDQQPTTGSGAPPAGPPRQQAIGTDNMAGQLNQQELARVQGGQPDVRPTGPTQAPVASVGSYGEGGYSDNPALARARRGEDPGPPSSYGGAPVAAPDAYQVGQRVIADPATPTQAPTQPGSYTAIGDSLAAHMIRKGGVRGQEDKDKINSYREGDTAVSGWDTKDVLRLIDKIPLGQIQGQNVVLSTGASNSPEDLAAIPQQIARLKELGAKSVSVLGVGTRKDFAGVNDKLAGFVANAKDPSVVFAGALPNVGGDQVHSTDPVSVFRSAQQALAKAGGGPAGTPTTGSGAAPTTAPAAGGEPATLPAGAPRALAPPGSTPTATSAPPIDRLKGNGGAMTPAGAVRAGAEGPNGVLTFIARNGPRGSSMGEGWDHYEDMLVRALIMKGDINGIQHAQEYVFRQKHKGAMENLMQAIGNMDDPNAAVQYLARSHAFVTDGTVVGFQVLNGQIYGQRYDEQTHDKIGKPFQVTEAGLRMQAIANSSAEKFLSNLNTERTTTETGRHNRNQEKHQDEELAVRQKIADQGLQEKQLEFDSRAADRRDEKEREDKRMRELQNERLQQQKDERERDRLARQDVANAAAREKADRDQEKRDEAERVRLERQADRATQEQAGHATKVEGWVDQYFGSGGALGSVTDPKAPGAIPAKDITKARDIFAGMLHHDKTVTTPDTAMEHTRNYLAGKYGDMGESVTGEGTKNEKRYASLIDENGNVVASVPIEIWRRYLPKQNKIPTVAPAGKSK